MAQVKVYLSASLIFFIFFGSSLAIYYSTPVLENHFPFIVSLRNNEGSHIECGTIISEKHVLAFAWTIINHRPKTVEAGSLILGEGQFHEIEKMLTHSNFVSQYGQDAIGLIWIKDEFTFGPNLQPAKFSAEQIGAEKPLVAIGWGGTEKIGGVSGRLRQANFLSLSDEQCKSDTEEAGWGRHYGRNILCAKGATNSRQKWCWWDYGAPLIDSERGLVVGFIHNHKNCPLNPNNVNLATRVEPYLQWIRDQINLKSYDIKIVENHSNETHVVEDTLNSNATSEQWIRDQINLKSHDINIVENQMENHNNETVDVEGTSNGNATSELL